jgi:protein tyrosine/serine phosphatase
MAHERVLDLEGVHNFRDYGGYSVAGGGRLRNGLLWRSGQHYGASDADMAKIGSLALETVIDLRGNSERANCPSPRPAGCRADVRFYDGETAGLAPHLAAADGVLDAEGARNAMLWLYEDIAFRPSLTSILRDLFSVALPRDGASLVHCHAGKDRTGIAVALVHHVAGVHRDDIFADYLLTNVVGNNEKRIADAVAGQADSGTFQRLPEAAIRVLMNVDAAFLDAALRAIADKYGSIDHFLDEVLDLNAAAREQLRERLIEG